MFGREEKQRLKQLLSDTLLLLCQNSLPVKSAFSIEAIIGLTLDDDEVVLVTVMESVSGGSASGILLIFYQSYLVMTVLLSLCVRYCTFPCICATFIFMVLYVVSSFVNRF